MHTVHIEFAPTPPAPSAPDFSDEQVQANDREYLFTYPNVMRMYVQDNHHIIAERLAQCDPVGLWTTLLGGGLSIAGFRKGFIPLHASVVVHNDGCYALAGQAGFGKSTLAASLMGMGFSLHAEDLCLIQPEEGGGYVAGSGVQEVRLWHDAADLLQWTDRTPFAQVPNLTKTVYREPTNPTVLLPLRRIYTLEFSDEQNPAGISRANGVQAMEILLQSLRIRIGMLSVGQKQKTFETLARVSQSVEIYRFVRPLDRAQLHEWSLCLARHIKAG